MARVADRRPAAGYVVFACNPRGSDGYGRDFRAALVNHWGEADLPDLMAGVEPVLAQGYVDPERLVITGGSYGGFMTAWVIGHDDRFRAAVAQRGVYDLLSFSGTTDIPRFAEWEFADDPWEDPQRLWQLLTGGPRGERSIPHSCSSTPRTTTGRPSLGRRAVCRPAPAETRGGDGALPPRRPRAVAQRRAQAPGGPAGADRGLVRQVRKIG